MRRRLRSSAIQTLQPGIRIGGYELLEPIGRGGMGEVWKARDVRLRREVAIKTLPGTLAQDAARLARLEREAELLAALNHPHIATIHGFEQVNGTSFLVLELVDGDTLEDRIAGGAMSARDALTLAQQIAQALEAAHRKNIIHRDLKPANIKITPDRRIKVLDFGIAKAVAMPHADETQTLSGATQEGVSVGTPAYMSPEQARGEPVGVQSDIWSFGAVLYEMLTGVSPFKRKTGAETIAQVLESQPDYGALPAATPELASGLVRRCLERDMPRRLQHMGDVRILVEEALASIDSTTVSAPVPRRRPWNIGRTIAEIVGAAVLSIAVAASAWHFKTAPASAVPIRSFTIPLPAGRQLAALDRGALAFSDDDSELAYVGSEGGVQRIYVRAMDTGATTAVAGTEGATMPFFSPDGQWLGFFSGGRLKKIPMRGGAVTPLTDVPSSFGATWAAGHTIVFASLWSVLEKVDDSATGAPQDLTRFDGGEKGHAWPRAVPGRRSILFSTLAERGISTISVSDLSPARIARCCPRAASGKRATPRPGT